MVKIQCSDVRGFDPPAYEPPPVKIYSLRDAVTVLEPAEAEVDGSLSTETRGDQVNLGFWFDAHSTAAWKLDVEAETKVRVTSTRSSVEPSALRLSFIGLKGRIDVDRSLPSTNDWGTFESVDFGSVLLPPDHYRVVAAPISEKWHPINLRALRLAKEIK